MGTAEAAAESAAGEAVEETAEVPADGASVVDACPVGETTDGAAGPAVDAREAGDEGAEAAFSLATTVLLAVVDGGICTSVVVACWAVSMYENALETEEAVL